MELREQIGIGESRGDDAFAEIGNGFGNNANALFLFQRQEKWAKKRAMHTVAKGELRRAEPGEKIGREIRKSIQRRSQQSVPVLGWI
jgi:hypothetical protein